MGGCSAKLELDVGGRAGNSADHRHKKSRETGSISANAETQANCENYYNIKVN